MIAKHVMNIHMNRPNQNGDENGEVVGEIDIDKMKRYIAFCKAYVAVPCSLGLRAQYLLDVTGRSCIALLMFAYPLLCLLFGAHCLVSEHPLLDGFPDSKAPLMTGLLLQLCRLVLAL